MIPSKNKKKKLSRNVDMNEKKITGFGPCEKLRCVWRPVMFSYSEISISNKYFVVNQKKNKKSNSVKSESIMDLI